MIKRLIYTVALALGMVACGPYVTPHLPTGRSEALQYTIIPLRADTMAQWSNPSARPLVPLSTPTSQPRSDEYDYEVGAGDLISLIIYTFDAKGEQSAIRVFPEGLPIAGEDEFLVDADGTITLPYVGRIQVEGKPFAKVKRMIERGLRNYFIEPQFQARVSRFAHGRVLVMGELEKPGEQRLSHEPLTISHAIEVAGGLRDSADLSAATLTHANGSMEALDLYALYYEGDTRANKVMQSGDKLTIPRGHGNQIFIAGEVLRPQAITMHPSGYSLTEALQQTGGVNPVTGDPSDIYVLRMASAQNAPTAQLNIFHLNAANLAHLALADRFRMQPRDIVYVSLQPITAWDRLLSQFLPGGLSTIVGPQFNKN